MTNSKKNPDNIENNDLHDIIFHKNERLVLI